MKKSILSKLTLAIVVCFMAITNVFGQAANPTGTYDAIHTVLIGSTYEYNVTLNQTDGADNKYTWEVVDAADATKVLDVLVDKGSNVQNIFWDPTKTWATDGNQVKLRVSEFATHSSGDGDVCSSISEITISLIGTQAQIAFDPNTDDFHCSGEDGTLVMKFNGYAPWNVTVERQDGTKILDNITLNSSDVTDVGGGYYTYTVTLAKADYLVTGGSDVTHTFTITAFDDKNTSKATGIEGTVANGTRKVTFYRLPEISTINHN